MVKLPTQKQRRIVRAKINGKKQREIGDIEYPNAKLPSKDVIISRELKKPHVAKYLEQSKLIALKESNITWKRVTDVISDSLDAEKQNNFTGEITPDYSTRLSAAKQARDLLDLPKETKDEELKEKLLDISENADEVQLLKIISKPR